MDHCQSQTLILDKGTIGRKLQRMALQIAEQNIGEERLLIAGIAGNGGVVAKELAAALQKITDITIEEATIHLNKKNPDEITVNGSDDFDNKVILLVDDVANTGRTMFYAMKPFLSARPRSVQTAVLVERSHKQFPIQSDYTGLSIATTLQEHIVVETDGVEITGAWLY